MRGLGALLTSSAVLCCHATLTITTVYKNAAADGTCQCAAKAVDYEFNPVSAAGLSTAASSQANAVNVTAAALFGGNDLTGYSTEVGGAGYSGTSAFITPLAYVYTGVQNWFGTNIVGAFSADTPQIGAGGIAIDYVKADAGFPHIGGMLQPGASVFVQTVFTTVVQTDTTTVTRPGSAASSTLGGGSGLSGIGNNVSSTLSRPVTYSASGFSQSTISTASSGAISINPDDAAIATGTSADGTLTTSGPSSTASAATPDSQSVMLVSNGQQFACQNGSLILLPMGQTGDVVVITNDGMLMCGMDMAFVYPSTSMRRRAIAGRAVSNSSAHYEIDIGMNGPSTATTNGFSVVQSILHLIVSEIELSFALFGSILEAYDPAFGIPMGATSLNISANPASSSSSTVATTVASTTTSVASNAAGTTASAGTGSGTTTTGSVTSSATGVGSSSALVAPTADGDDAAPSSSSNSVYPTYSASASSSSSATKLAMSGSSSSSAAPTTTVTPEVIQGCTLSTTKNVFAHMIVGNLYNYQQADYYNDFKLAASYGLDAMALNVGRDSWELASTALAYQAAAQLFTDTGVCFKVFVSLDMSSFSADFAPDGSYVMPYVSNFKSHPAQYFYNDRHFVSTYGGYQQFDWVETFVDPLAAEGINIYFVPAYSIATYAAAAYATPESDGQFLWNAWPNDAATGQPTDTTISEALADEYINNKGSKSLMLNISPWFSTHFSNDVKNMIFRSEGLWQQRWTQMINDLRDGTDLLQITSWNDFGESHYLGPVGADEPNVLYPEDSEGVSSLEWVYFNDPVVGQGSNMQYLDHSAFADQAVAWIQAFKTGVFPTITPFAGTLTGTSADDALLATYQADPNADRMYVSYRLQYSDAVTSEAASREPTGSTYAQDAIVVDTYLSTPGTLYVAWSNLSDTDGTVLQTASQTTYQIAAGKVQTFASFTDPANSDSRRYGTPAISIATGAGGDYYALQMDALLPIMTPKIASGSIINFNAYTKKFTRYSTLVTPPTTSST